MKKKPIDQGLALIINFNKKIRYFNLHMCFETTYIQNFEAKKTLGRSELQKMIKKKNMTPPPPFE